MIIYICPNKNSLSLSLYLYLHLFISPPFSLLKSTMCKPNFHQWKAHFLPLLSEQHWRKNSPRGRRNFSLHKFDIFYFSLEESLHIFFAVNWCVCVAFLRVCTHVIEINWSNWFIRLPLYHAKNSLSLSFIGSVNERIART